MSVAEGGAEAKVIGVGLVDGSAVIADAGPVNLLGALFMQTPIMSDMEWPLPEGSTRRDPDREKVVRIGYIRRGGKVPVIPEAHKKANCLDGWYELVAGGFVCGKYATLDMNHPKVKFGPHAPDMNAPLPYLYGYNITNGTPLYRTMPSKEDRKLLEPWLTARPKAKVEDDNPYDDNLDAGARPPLYVGAPTEESETPWYMKSYDGGKPPVTLDDLKGEGPIVRRMVKGFYLALDEELKKEELKRGRKEEKWWKTVSGDIVPMDRIYLAKPLTDFHGVWLTTPPPNLPTVPGNPPAQDAGVAEPAIKLPTKLPVGFILWHGHKYTPSEDGKKMVKGDSLSRFTAIGLSGKKMELGGFRYHESEDGTFWMRSADGQITSPGPAPKGLLPNEKWIDVNLDSQTLVAYEGDKPVYVTLTSTGKKDKDGDKEKDHRTKPGEFRIREKHIAATMDGDVATDGPYSIEDVPWIMYFNGSIALHGAFWHANFGHIQSHGCVNLAPLDARAMFGWTEPQLPEGWHGVMSTPQKPGTRVIVHETWDPNDPLSIKPIAH
ncbi:MAG: L,D-transpeptidase [Polyangiaceae bacterium]